jgi:flagellar motor switch protein FliG
MSEMTPVPAPAMLPADHAAVMLMLLAEDQTQAILSELDPAELRLLGEKMCALGEIDPETIVAAIAGFVEKTENLGLVAHDRIGQVHTMMTRALGPTKADNLMRRIAPEAGSPALDLARWLNPDAIAPLIENEHPQAVAVLLVQLDPEVAAQVLHMLPEAQQGAIVHRIATIGPVSPDAIAMLEDLLGRRIAERHGMRPFEMGGAKDAAAIINGAGKAVEKRVMGEIVKADKVLAREIEAEMFRFEHLFVLDAKAMGTLLRDVPSDVLIDALKGISEDERDVFFRAMSTRAADGVKDEIAERGRLKLADVVAAQKQVVAVARKLAADGTLILGSGDDEYV